MRARAAIVGVADHMSGQRRFADAYWAMHAELAAAAVADAGLAPTDVDGVVFSVSGYPTPKRVFPTTVCEYLGIRPAWMETVSHGGAQTSSMLWRAAAGIVNGFASVVLVLSADNRHGRFGRDSTVARIAERNMDVEFEVPYGPLFQSNFALLARRMMHVHATTPEHFAGVAVAQRRWAGLHPDAHRREPITVDDVLDSPMISSPLHRLDICLMTDGGAAAVVVGAERAARLPRDPVYLLGFGECGDSQHVTQMTDLDAPALLRRAASRAFAMAGVSPADVDIAYPNDPATPYVLWGLEQMGLVAPGAAGEFVAGGGTMPGGVLPCNTHGGLLSHGHPGIAGAMIAAVEAVRQLRGSAGQRQVPGARVALVNSMGGFMTTGVNLLGSQAAL